MNDVRWNFHEISAFMTFEKFWRGSLWDGKSYNATNDATDAQIVADLKGNFRFESKKLTSTLKK